MPQHTVAADEFQAYDLAINRMQIRWLTATDDAQMNHRKYYDRVVSKPSGARCNICETIAPLTEDHVPPQCCLEFSNVEIEPFENRLRGSQAKLPWSQDGVRFKTICGDCNSKLGKVDPVVGKWCAQVRGWLQSPLTLSDRWTFRVRRERLLPAFSAISLPRPPTTRTAFRNGRCVRSSEDLC